MIRSMIFILAAMLLTSSPAWAEKMAVPCLTADEVKPQMDLPHLYESLLTCFQDKRYSDAANLYAIGSTYGRFDTLRVKDVTAHPQVSHALTLIFLRVTDTEGKRKMSDMIRTELGDLGRVCKMLWKIGKPDYEPRYMIDFGNDKTIPKTGNDWQTPNFDPHSAWLKSLNESWRCPIDGL